jgi:predicted PurR-regulated permease PerM
VPPERVVILRPRTILSVAGILIGLALALWIVFVARQALTWVVISVFLALALNPAIEWLERRLGFQRRGVAAAIIYVATFAALVGLGFLLIPPLVDQVTGLVDAVPGYVKDLTHGRGPLGFLETKYHVVEKVQDAVHKKGTTGLFAGGASTALSITKGILTFVVALVTIAFMTFFMVLEGPAWVDRLYALVPPENQPRWRRVGARVAQTVSGYVTGNLLISLIAGTSAGLVLFALGVPFAMALGLFVAILDLVPLAGATIAGIVVVTVAALTSVTAGVIMAVFIIVYQQIENHLLQPLVYGRTVELSPLVVLISVLVGAEVAGVLGALLAIPVAGTLQIVLQDWAEHRPARRAAADGQARDDRIAPEESPAPG